MGWWLAVQPIRWRLAVRCCRPSIQRSSQLEHAHDQDMQVDNI
jgi:hypothetical protein